MNDANIETDVMCNMETVALPRNLLITKINQLTKYSCHIGKCRSAIFSDTIYNILYQSNLSNTTVGMIQNKKDMVSYQTVENLLTCAYNIFYKIQMQEKYIYIIKGKTF